MTCSSRSGWMNEPPKTPSPTTRSLQISLPSFTRYYYIYNYSQSEKIDTWMLSFHFCLPACMPCSQAISNLMINFQAGVTDGCSRTVGNLIYTVKINFVCMLIFQCVVKFVLLCMSQ